MRGAARKGHQKNANRRSMKPFLWHRRSRVSISLQTRYSGCRGIAAITSKRRRWTCDSAADTYPDAADAGAADTDAAAEYDDDDDDG